MSRVIAKCINDCEGDFWDITPNKIYKILKIEEKHKKYLILDDKNEKYYYPQTCFRLI